MNEAVEGSPGQRERRRGVRGEECRVGLRERREILELSRGRECGGALEEALYARVYFVVDIRKGRCRAIS